ncbi:DUF2512 family protein [Alteribacillus iranensis]|uniref:4 TMS phage holin, superfamily IV n=1 Tax=Alteribacillus iranensis TaxID=930128 RepID=A0A1I2E008_9BACI|nr:DUF2512 family protein [Alteribacillus iranensis]SFE86165.1 Protein of unknown function [Alteribacillus iranensis]
MEHLKALAMKGIMTLLVLWVVFSGIFGLLNFGQVLLITIILGAISYAVGDLALLPKTKNSIVTMADFAFLFVALFLLGWIWVEATRFLGGAAFISAGVITVGEYFFHNYLKNNILREEHPVKPSEE